MTFAGDLPASPSAIRATDGQDSVGQFHTVEFDYGGRTSSITAYPELGAIVFATTYAPDNLGLGAFPVLSQIPRLPYTLSYHDTPFS